MTKPYESTAARNARLSNERYIEHARKKDQERLESYRSSTPVTVVPGSEPAPLPPERMLSKWGHRLLGWAISIAAFALILSFFILMYVLDKVRFNVVF